MTENLPIPIDDNGDIVKSNVGGIDEIIERFIKDQSVVEKSKRAYRSNIRLFFSWVEKKKLTPQNLQLADIIKYKEELLEEGKSVTTVSAYVSSVRRFYEWAEAVELVKKNIAKTVKVPKIRSAFRKEGLTPEQSTQLLDYFRAKGSKRDFAIINLMLRMGLRTIEVSRILWGDILFKSGARVLMIHGKGRLEKDEWVRMSDEVYFPIKDYLSEREEITEKSCVFTSESSNGTEGKALDKEYISKIAKRGLIGIGLDGKQYTAHSLRHSTAINLLRAGATLEDVSKVLRHASISTTQIYTKSIDDEMRILKNTEQKLDDMF